MPIAESHDDQTHYANVDLDIYSRSDLETLVSVFGERVMVLFSGRRKRTYETHLELSYFKRGRSYAPGPMIGMFCSLIESLDPAHRKIWDAAKRRVFCAGIQTGNLGPRSTDFGIGPDVLARAAALNAEIVFTIYAPTESACWK